MSVVRTRFAPSPTGYMHIGGMRTALFNWLWARHNGGQFILRIDDTDAARNMDEALGPILDAFRWLGLDWDEGPEVGGDFGPYFQSERGELYSTALQQLLASGDVYRDFDDPEQVRQEREAAEKAKTVYLNPRRSLEFSESEIEAKVAAGDKFVYRLKVPRDQKIKIVDHVRGEVEWDCSTMNDPAVARGDGSPLYNFATVVDDNALQITHVIRAEEHLSNVPPQYLLYKALGYDSIPEFAHIPFVSAPGGKKKMSKRDVAKYRKNPQFSKMFEFGDAVFSRMGIEVNDAVLSPVMVAYYEQVGYTPAGVLNALGRLGWSYDDKTEFFSRDELVEHFTLDRVVKAAAGLDPDKLMSYQAHWMNTLPEAEKVSGCAKFLAAAKLISQTPSEEEFARIGKVVNAAEDRIRVFADILEFDEFFVDDADMPFDAKAFKKRVQKPESAVQLLTELKDELQSVEPFSAKATDDFLHAFVEKREMGIGQIIHALRVAVTGKAKGVGMFDALDLLGRDSAVARIERAITVASSSGGEA
ncbi:MAG: glutamate--tRNA ligase [Planctomycetaceae bacterium]